MPTIHEITTFLESLAPLPYQESYDNAGLITGSGQWTCKGVLVTLDATEEVVQEAIQKGCNLVVAHHPILFRGLKKINGNDYVEKSIIHAIKNDVALYAIHTNLDNVKRGVNNRIADRLGLVNRSVLLPKGGTLKKLFTFVPLEQAEAVKNALFEAGGGQIGNYSECSFSVQGAGTFTAGEHTDPFVGRKGERHTETEIKLEMVFPEYLEKRLVQALIKAHPYEEVAYDVVLLSNAHPGVGAGLLGELPQPAGEGDMLRLLKERFQLRVIRHTRLLGKPLKKVAVCGGAGSFLISKALQAGADMYITADIKYHEFFDANGRMVIADIGHYESEQYTVDLLLELLKQKFSTFALLKTEVSTNPVCYFTS
ncbi:MAG: Nif3-like dinuclear metal center hexameric protein [Williamsia sp.]|nr:Nif3-like dinuclear metal center hexameric protein [Williamsia sp.]